MFELFGSAATAILGGGITGILGTSITAIFEFANRKAASKHELKMREMDITEMKEEWAMRTKVVEIEAAAATDVADAQLMSTSYSMQGPVFATGERWRNSMPYMILDLIRGAIRPLITIFLGWVAWQIYQDLAVVLAANGRGITVTQAMTLMETIVNTILYMASSSILWWFGTRMKMKIGG